jgi:alkylation response protein AidB-like acyl-CoA dehydrogenase
MDFAIPAEEQALADEIGSYARDVLMTRAASIDASGAFPTTTSASSQRWACLAVNIPAEYGGVGASALGIALVMESVTPAAPATASAVGAHYLATMRF